MKVLKITDGKGDVYYTDAPELEREGCAVETVEMSAEEYNAIPTTQSSADFFKE